MKTGANLASQICMPGHPAYRVDSRGRDPLSILAEDYGATYVRVGLSSVISDSFMPPYVIGQPYTQATATTSVAVNPAISDWQTFWRRCADYGMTIICVLNPPQYSYTDGTHTDGNHNPIAYLSNGTLPANTRQVFGSGSAYDQAVHWFGTNSPGNLLAYNPHTILDAFNECAMDAEQLANMAAFYSAMKASSDPALAALPITYGGWQAAPFGTPASYNVTPAAMAAAQLSPRIVDVLSVHIYVHQQDIATGTTAFLDALAGVSGIGAVPLIISESGAPNGKTFSACDLFYASTLQTQATGWQQIRQAVAAAPLPVQALLAYELVTPTIATPGQMLPTSVAGISVVGTNHYALLDNDLTPFPAASVALVP